MTAGEDTAEPICVLRRRRSCCLAPPGASTERESEVCVRESERVTFCEKERGGEKEREKERVCVCVCACVSVCERERQNQREFLKKRERCWRVGSRAKNSTHAMSFHGYPRGHMATF